MLYFTSEVFHRLANQNQGHIRVMLEYHLYLKNSGDHLSLCPPMYACVFYDTLIENERHC